jgi:hypothetical protein
MSRTCVLVVVYDLRDGSAWQAARRHRSLWGKTHTRVHYLEEHVVVLAFCPAPGQRWRVWEALRQSMILGELQGSEAA